MVGRPCMQYENTYRAYVTFYLLASSSRFKPRFIHLYAGFDKKLANMLQHCAIARNTKPNLKVIHAHNQLANIIDSVFTQAPC